SIGSLRSCCSYASAGAALRRLFAAQASVEKRLDRKPIRTVRWYADLFLEPEWGCRRASNRGAYATLCARSTTFPRRARAREDFAWRTSHDSSGVTERRARSSTAERCDRAQHSESGAPADRGRITAYLPGADGGCDHHVFWQHELRVPARSLVWPVDTAQ